MPVMGGIEAARQVRLLGTQITQPHMVALTASTSADDHAQANQAGMQT